MSEAAAPSAGEKSPSRGVQRRRAFLEAATDVFLEQGYEAASVNEVVRRSGGSLATLYAQFQNKEGLFLAVVESAMERFTETMTEATDFSQPVESGLQKIGERFLESILFPRSLDFFRIVLGESRKFPDLMVQFLWHGPERVRASIAEYLLARAEKDGLTLSSDEADRGAEFFCDMVRARHQYRALSEKNYELSQEQRSEHVRAAVMMLLHGVAKT